MTQDELKTHLHYDELTGVLTWVKEKAGRVSGKCGTYNSRGYKQIGINGKQYYGHRLAWLYMTGSFPVLTIDHIDHNVKNNQWSNLRDVSQRNNAMNQSLNSKNTSGNAGVCFHKQNKNWTAEIMVHQKKKHLGSFANFDDAVIARQEAEKLYGFHKNHCK